MSDYAIYLETGRPAEDLLLYSNDVPSVKDVNTSEFKNNYSLNFGFSAYDNSQIKRYWKMQYV